VRDTMAMRNGVSAQAESGNEANTIVGATIAAILHAVVHKRMIPSQTDTTLPTAFADASDRLP
jgi:hypothetical protein